MTGRVELFLDGAWVDVTDDVDRRARIEMSRGRSDEADRADPATCKVTLDNTDGRYSPRNPTSVYAGAIGRNTPLRIVVNRGDTYLALSGAGRASTPDSAAVEVTGDLDVRIAVRLDTDPADAANSQTELAGKYVFTTDQRSWRLLIDSQWRVRLSWSPDGVALVQAAASTVPVAPTGQATVIRATLDVDNPAVGGWQVRYYHGPTIVGPWTELGDPINGTAATGIFDSTSPVEVGDITNLGFGGVDGRVLRFQLRDGIDGTVVADADFAAQTAGVTSFDDAQGNTWTLAGDAELTDRRVRFVGEVAAWPVTAVRAGGHATVAVRAAGILRRLGQGAAPVGSTLYYALTTGATPNVVAYWPAEDTRGSTQVAAASPGTAAMQIVRGIPDWEANTDFAASKPLPRLADTYWLGTVPDHDAGAYQLRILVSIPAAGTVAGETIAALLTTGTAARWEIVYDGTQDLRLRAYDSDDNQIVNSTALTVDLDGAPARLSVEITEDGGDVDWLLGELQPGAGVGFFVSGTLAGATLGKATRVLVNTDGGHTDVAVGHISLQNTITSFFDLADQLAAYVGEAAGRRVERLCVERSIAFRGIGRLDDTTAMGAQQPATLVDLFRECVDADQGILTEPRDQLGILYRTRLSLERQPSTLDLDYANLELADQLAVVDDDQQTRNDVTVTRQGGSSARVVVDDGPLSTQPPPDGVGRYDEDVTVNLRDDGQLADHAGWRTHLGTVDTARVPTIDVDLVNPRVAGKVTRILDAEIGDRVIVDDLPGWVAPGPVDQLIQGVAEQIDLDGRPHRLTWNGAPADPYRTGVYDDPDARYDTAGTQVHDLTVDETATQFDVRTQVGPLWTTDPAEFPFDVIVAPGERMTVTSIADVVIDIQEFTVIRGVGGAATTHAVGDDVRLADPAYYALR